MPVNPDVHRLTVRSADSNRTDEIGPVVAENLTFSCSNIAFRSEDVYLNPHSRTVMTNGMVAVLVQSSQVFASSYRCGRNTRMEEAVLSSLHSPSQH